jgi:hypothetical protein
MLSAARPGAGEVLAAAGLAAGTGLRRSADVALQSAASICFALGAATIEQFKHLPAGEAGPLAGLAALRGARTIRPRLAAIAGAGLAVHRTNVARLVMASVGSSLPMMMAPGCHRASHNHTLRRGLVWRLLRSGSPCFRG